MTTADRQPAPHSRFTLLFVVRGLLSWAHGLVWLRERELWVVLLAGLVLWTLAYQWPYTHRLDFGGDPIRHRREDDAPYLRGSFYASEPAPLHGQEWWESGVEPYRWTRADSAIALPGIGGGTWIAAIRARGQPTGRVTLSRWSDGSTTATLPLAETARVYRVLARADAYGDLVLRLSTEPYAPPDDPRALGFVSYRAVFIPVGYCRLPALPQLGLLGASLALAYGLARRLGLPRCITAASGLALAAGLGFLLARTRLGLTLFTPALLGLAAACYGLGLALLHLPLTGRLPAINQRSAIINSRAAVAALVVMAFALRLGGMLHPAVRFSDLRLHANNLQELTRSGVYMTEALPARAGGGVAPYPPGQYIVLAPWQLVAPVSNDGRELVVKAGNALLDSLVAGLLWYVLLMCGAGPRAALIGAALYVAPTPLLKSFSVGEFANIFGQGLAMPLLALLAVKGRHLAQRRTLAAALALLGLALLGHLGVVISLVLVLLCLALVWLVARRAGLPVGALVLLGLVAGGLAGLFYYSLFLDLLAQRLPGAASSSPAGPSRSFVEQLGGIARGLGRQNNPLSPLMLALGAGGIALLARARPSGPGGLWLLLLAWWGSAMLSFGLLLFSDQLVRWDLFLYPALCLGAGSALAAVWQRGSAGKTVAILLVAFLLWRGAALWVGQLADFLH